MSSCCCTAAPPAQRSALAEPSARPLDVHGSTCADVSPPVGAHVDTSVFIMGGFDLQNAFCLLQKLKGRCTCWSDLLSGFCECDLESVPVQNVSPLWNVSRCLWSPAALMTCHDCCHWLRYVCKATRAVSQFRVCVLLLLKNPS